MNKIIGIIPARMESSRFPGKPLALINNIPMITRVYLNSKKSKLLNDLYVATCNYEIRDEILNHTKDVVITDKFHKNCVSRCIEALGIIEEKNDTKYDFIVIIQGDEPMVTGNMIDTCICHLNKCNNIKRWADIVNLGTKIKKDEYNNKNIVKMFTYPKNDIVVLYGRFKVVDHLDIYKQSCCIVFRRKSLKSFSVFGQYLYSSLTNIDMLKYLECNFGHIIRVCYVDDVVYSVDVKEDISKIDKFLTKTGGISE